MLPHRKRILCVEDDEDVCSMIQTLLGFIGYDVTIVQTMAAALTGIEAEQFDLYLLDSWLPGGSGVDLCRNIRALGVVVPIIFYSGAAYEDDKRQALEAGADAYLIKPTDVHKLVETIKRLC
ncbi:MAG: response regulator [Acidobacteria bacterium]|nr:response regulator [Acidobacteriota bacterium]